MGSEFARNMIEALRAAVLDAEVRTLEMEGPFGYPTMAYPDFLDPKTFYTLRGVRAGLAAIAPLRARTAEPTEEDLLALAETITDSHGITSFFHAGRVPRLEELENGGAPVLAPDRAFTENTGHYFDDSRPSLWIVYEHRPDVRRFVRRLDFAFTQFGWRVETDYKHEEELLFGNGRGWGLVVRDLCLCDAALSVRTDEGLRSLNSFGGMEGPGGLRGIQYELETLRLVSKPYCTTTLDDELSLSSDDFLKHARELNQILRVDFLRRRD
jgi:hypothetical protein